VYDGDKYDPIDPATAAYLLDRSSGEGQRAAGAGGGGGVAEAGHDAEGYQVAGTAGEVVITSDLFPSPRHDRWEIWAFSARVRTFPD
jgi:hypothetical protein